MSKVSRSTSNTVASDDQFLKNYDAVNSWLKRHRVSAASIEPSSLIVNTSGGVFLSNFRLKSLPVKFGTVGGDFICENNKLTSLEGSPSRVEGSMNCDNNPLTSLDFLPKNVYGILMIPTKMRIKYTDEAIRSISRVGSAILPLEKGGFFKNLFATKTQSKRRGKKIISAVGDYENELEARSFINLDSLANELVLALEDTGNSVDTNGGAGDEALFEAPYKAYCFVAKKTEDGSKSQVLYLNKNSFDSVPHDIGGVNLTRDEYASLFRKLEEAFDNLKVSPVLNAEDKYVQFI